MAWSGPPALSKTGAYRPLRRPGFRVELYIIIVVGRATWRQHQQAEPKMKDGRTREASRTRESERPGAAEFIGKIEHRTETEEIIDVKARLDE